MKILNSDYPLHHPDAASRVFEGEAVIISPAQNKVRMLNQVGTRIWELADGSRSVADIAAGLTAEFDIDDEHALAGVTDFVQALIGQQLMTFKVTEKDSDG